MAPKEFSELAKKNGARMMALKFVDMLGLWQHCSYPIATIDGGVFSESLIRSWISWKRCNEIDEIALRPHPHEFHLYYDS